MDGDLPAVGRRQGQQARAGCHRWHHLDQRVDVKGAVHHRPEQVRPVGQAHDAVHRGSVGLGHRHGGEREHAKRWRGEHPHRSLRRDHPHQRSAVPRHLSSAEGLDRPRVGLGQAEGHLPSLGAGTARRNSGLGPVVLGDEGIEQVAQRLTHPHRAVRHGIDDSHHRRRRRRDVAVLVEDPIQRSCRWNCPGARPTSR